jgi:sodium transport system permease protein
MGSKPWMYPIPMVGQQALLTDVLGGKSPGAAMFVAAALTSLVVASICLALTTRLLHRERIIFGR